MADIIDGKKIAEGIKSQVTREVAGLKKKGINPGLAVILVGSNEASKVYVKNKHTACTRTGIESFTYNLPEDTGEKELIQVIHKLNTDPNVHGILVQLALPKHIDEFKVITAIDPKKDVDGFHPVNVGLLTLNRKCLKPCTPSGIIHLIESTGAQIEGKHALIVGRSNIVGKPVATMLLARHATVTICHSKTTKLEDEIRRADIVIAAIGKPNFIKGSWIKKDAIVIDVGINRTNDGKLIGDVDFDEAKKVASAITPVPGGVGPMTIAMLLKNTVEAAKDSVSQ